MKASVSEILKEVYTTGANDVYGVKDENGNEILIPAIKTVHYCS